MIEVLAYIVVIAGYTIALAMLWRVIMVAYTLRSEVPFVPSGERAVENALKVMDIRPKDRVVDIGSGSGRFLIEAARKYPDAHFTGIELNRFLVFISKVKAKLLGLSNVSFHKGDTTTFNYARFNRIYMYMTTGFIATMMDKIEKEVEEGTIVVSVHFGFGKKFEDTHDIAVHQFDKLIGTDRISSWVK